ncbi:MAG: dihydropteroate synthase [Nitrospiraceae bacterium]|nr:dihydropteroate synthase [Nitrospiraceae bacterium]
MHVIGERLNGMFKDVRKALEEQDVAAIQDLAKAQVNAGAGILDLNVGPAKVDPLEGMRWLIETAAAATEVPLAIDNPKWEIQKAVVPMLGDRAIINSCKADEEELDKYMALAVENNAGLVALTIDKQGVPSDVDRRVELGAQIGAKAMEAGLPMDKLYIDPIILPVNVAPKQPENVLAALEQLKMLSDPPPHFVLGLSNVSQGCNHRSLINRIYLVMAMSAGLDSAIMDPTDKDLMDAVITTELLQEKMIYCDSFLDAQRMRG